MSVPRAVLLHHLSTTAARVMVEVETTQGYVYEGHLISIDPYYNLTLREATVRRHRRCDWERAALRNHYRQLLSSSVGSGLAHDEDLAGLPEELVERSGSATLPRPLLGDVLLKSSQTVSVVFLPSTPTTAAGGGAARQTAVGGGLLAVLQRGGPQPSEEDVAEVTASQRGGSISVLQTAFVKTAATVKKKMAEERMRNRAARRARVAAKAKVAAQQRKA